MPARTSKGITWTVEPFDFDGVGNTPYNITQNAFGGTFCPCVKIPYKSTGIPKDSRQGADNIWRAVQKGLIKKGDTVMGFSLGVQVISLFLSQHELPEGVRVVLAGDTLAANQMFLDLGPGGVNMGMGGIPWNIKNDVHMIANEFDFSDQPDITSSPNYRLAMKNHNEAKKRVHNYTFARLGHPGNLVFKRGNITSEIVPVKKLPLSAWLRDAGRDTEADAADINNRPLVESA